MNVVTELDEARIASSFRCEVPHDGYRSSWTAAVHRRSVVGSERYRTVEASDPLWSTDPVNTARWCRSMDRLRGTDHKSANVLYAYYGMRGDQWSSLRSPSVDIGVSLGPGRIGAVYGLTDNATTLFAGIGRGLGTRLAGTPIPRIDQAISLLRRRKRQLSRVVAINSAHAATRIAAAASSFLEDELVMLLALRGLHRTRAKVANGDTGDRVIGALLITEDLMPSPRGSRWIAETRTQAETLLRVAWSAWASVTS